MRYIVVKDQNNNKLVVDTKGQPRVVCICFGWNGINDADMVCKVLNKYDEPIASLLKTATKKKSIKNAKI